MATTLAPQKTDGKTDYVVADLSLADFGRAEINIAETEMPGLMALREEFGAAQPLILASVSELFGLKYYSTLYNFCGTASPVGSYILNVRVAGRMYDQEAARQGKGVTTCIGVRCYKESFLVITAVTVAAAVVTAALAWGTREFYAGDIYAKFKEGTSSGDAIGEGDRVQPPKEEQL